jgi:hypothetical protein
MSYTIPPGLDPSFFDTKPKNEAVPEHAKAPENAIAGKAAALSIQESKNASVVAHLFNDGKDLSEASLKIIYEEAIAAINLQLRQDLGLSSDAPAPVSHQTLNATGNDYWTPESTANRIISGSLAFLPAFQEAHPDLSPQESYDHFLKVVGGGLEQGFADAKKVLDDIGILEDEGIAKLIADTQTLTLEGFKQRAADYFNTEESANVTD